LRGDSRSNLGLQQSIVAAIIIMLKNLWRLSMWNKILSLIIGTLIMLSCLVMTGCPNSKPTPIYVDNVYYTNLTYDEYYFGGTEHKDVLMYMNGIDFNTNLLAANPKEYKIDWKSMCNVDNNEIIFATKSSLSYGFPRNAIDIRLKYPFDPTNDIGKKVHFNTNKTFEIDGGSGGEMSGTYYDTVYIATPEKINDFIYYQDK
jgi:hypothetical protein